MRGNQIRNLLLENVSGVFVGTLTRDPKQSPIIGMQLFDFDSFTETRGKAWGQIFYPLSKQNSGLKNV